METRPSCSVGLARAAVDALYFFIDELDCCVRCISEHLLYRRREQKENIFHLAAFGGCRQELFLIVYFSFCVLQRTSSGKIIQPQRQLMFFVSAHKTILSPCENTLVDVVVEATLTQAGRCTAVRPSTDRGYSDRCIGFCPSRILLCKKMLSELRHACIAWGTTLLILLLGSRIFLLKDGCDGTTNGLFDSLK